MNTDFSVTSFTNLYIPISSLLITIIAWLLPQPPRNPSLLAVLWAGLRAKRSYILAATIGAIAASILGGVHVGSAVKPQWTTNLTDGAVVPQNNTLTITHPADVQGYIWLIQQQENTKFYPSALRLDPNRCEVIPLATTGTIAKAPVVFGNETDYGQHYTLLVVVADEAANQALMNRHTSQ